MVRYLARAAALGCAAMLLGGCATVIHGTTQEVRIESNPPGADVAIDQSQHIITPATVRLARGSSHVLLFHKPGYEDSTQNLNSTPSGWILGNLIAGGVIGIAVDASDGAGRKLSDAVNVALTPLPSAPVMAAPGYDLQGLFPAAATPSQAPKPPPAVHDAEEDEPLNPAVLPEAAPQDFTDDEAGFAPPARRK